MDTGGIWAHPLVYRPASCWVPGTRSVWLGLENQTKSIRSSWSTPPLVYYRAPADGIRPTGSLIKCFDSQNCHWVVEIRVISKDYGRLFTILLKEKTTFYLSKLFQLQAKIMVNEPVWLFEEIVVKAGSAELRAKHQPFEEKHKYQQIWRKTGT